MARLAQAAAALQTLTLAQRPSRRRRRRTRPPRLRRRRFFRKTVRFFRRFFVGFLDPFFSRDRFFSGLVYLASVRSIVRFNERVHPLDPDNERSFVNLFVVFLFLGLNPRFL